MFSSSRVCVPSFAAGRIAAYIYRRPSCLSTKRSSDTVSGNVCDIAASFDNTATQIEVVQVAQRPLDGKVALVSGGSTGIGRGIVLGLAEAGADVCVVARTRPALDEVCELARSCGIRAEPIQVDAATEHGAEVATARAVEAFGRIDVLVNNLGGSSGSRFRPGPLLALSPSDLDGCMDLNVKSPFLMSSRVAPVMLDQGSGSIINIASLAGLLHSAPVANMGFYPMAKTALIALTRTMAVEWAPAVRVNAIAPGIIGTPRILDKGMASESAEELDGIPLRRLGTAEDVATAVVYLASEASSWVTGTTLEVHGGLTPAVRYIDV